jgi:PAB-dependent poly(A)-specific ribonuclease subunit 2
MGIKSLLPPGHGYIASVSPAGVRLHSHGGLQLIDCHTEGMCCGALNTHHGESQATHITVGGQALGKDITDKSGKQQVLCMDLYSGLRVVATYSIDRRNPSSSAAVTAMAALKAQNAVVAGCTDGTIRLIDSRLREMAKIQSHIGGVVGLAVSPDCTLLASTGYGSRGRPNSGTLHAYPDPTAFVYDMRYLGRGGIPHPFAGVGSGPRYVEFLPDMPGLATNRFVVASGQPGGGLQILEPFQEAVDASALNFIIPSLSRGESITCIGLLEDQLGLGTSNGNIVQYQLAGFERSEKNVLELPPLTPPAPAMSMDPTLLSSPDPSRRRNETSDAFRSIFSAYIMTKETLVSSLKSPATFGPLISQPIIDGGTVHVSDNLMQNASHSVDFVTTIPTADLQLDLMCDFSGSKNSRTGKGSTPKQNANKLLHTKKLYNAVYGESLNRSKKGGKSAVNDDSGGMGEENEGIDIPSAYRLAMRPAGKLAGLFSHADYNSSGMLPGWDYPPSMPNAFVPSILMLLYCIPEMRNAMLDLQTAERVNITWREKMMAPEIGFLFHRINALVQYALIYPSNLPSKTPRLEAWAPMNFISCLASSPEAEQLQILDGSPAAVDMARRAEAFYRFLLYQIDKETTKGTSSKVMDSFGGMDFTSVNEFVKGDGPPTTSTTRAMTIELFYEPFLNKPESSPSFGEVLQRTLCREMPLRAWNKASSSFETIIQRKVATSLPTLLSLSCACAGRKEEEGLSLWRRNIPYGWLPEKVEIELADSGDVIVRELVVDHETKQETWKDFASTKTVPPAISALIAESRSHSTSNNKRRYRLEAVVSLVRDDLDRMSTESGGAGGQGHQVLHIRVAKALALQTMRAQVETTLSTIDKIKSRETTIVGAADINTLLARMEQLESDMNNFPSEQWYLMNGYSVSQSSSQDARTFHQKFREPSLCIFRAEDSLNERTHAVLESTFKVPPEILRTQSLTDGSKSRHVFNQKPSLLPGEGDYVAFDAEFVSVQEEVSTLTDRGAKVTIQEPRHVIARISVIDCRSRCVLLDDHVVPREPVVDYLTRFSGIVEKDLDPKTSNRHLISTRTAYLKLRLLIERGCIFVGHGLKQDFWTANLVVPPSQIVDTVEIYHKPAQRYVSLRFLTNFILKRDMQQDIHDSVEDATAAFELFQKSEAMKRAGLFEQALDELYAYGQKTDWKIGVEIEASKS